MPAPITPEDPGSVNVLMIEDDDDIAALLVQVFAANPAYASTVTHVEDLAGGLELLRTGSFEAVILDLGLPDSEGLSTVRRVVDAVTGGVAVVVVTARGDRGLAARSLELGAQDYIVKEDLTPQLVTRVVWHGVTRSRLVQELSRARRGEERERELRRMERMAAAQASTTPVSAAMLGGGSVQERVGQSYEADFVAEYRRILELALDEQAYRGTEVAQDELRALATLLGFVGAGPRDVIELHMRCLRDLVREDEGRRTAAGIEEARVLVLELMGRLVAYYRERSIGHQESRSTESRPSSTASEDGS